MMIPLPITRAGKSGLAAVILLLATLLTETGCILRVSAPASSSALSPELSYATTPDGWRLAMHRYRPTAGPDQAASSRPTAQAPKGPVILSHGLACNRFTWDLTDELSLARALSRQGYDVWMVELRGHGKSAHPRRRAKALADWGIDQHALIDVPTAIAHVRTATGAAQVDWIGHSMGGMIIYMYLGATLSSEVRNVVTIASPGSLNHANRLVRLALQSVRAIALFDRIKVGALARGYGTFSGRLPGGYEETLWHIQNVSPQTSRLMLRQGLEDIERGVAQSFESVFRSGRLVSRDGSTDYQSLLTRIRQPLLAIAGKVDGLAPPFNVLQAFEQVGSPDKTYELLSRSNGYHADYGHGDLLLGEHAPADTYALVSRWLDARQGPPASTRPEFASRSGVDVP